jgi:hypothetical protein
MKSQTSADQRKVLRLLPRLVSWGITIVVLLVVGVLLWGTLSPPQFRQTLVIVDDPVHVVSFDIKRGRVTAADIPLDTVISAAFGYGKYSMRAIISLDAIDRKHGELIMGSVSNALGLPVRGIVVGSGGGGESANISSLRRVFGLGSMLSPLIDRSRTSVSFATWLHLVRTVATLSADAVRVVDLSPAMVPTTSPDGSMVPILDASRVDYILSDTFFDADLRAENISVAVYNTTSVPAIGSRASRILSRVGMQLVFIGNSEPELERCRITGSEAAQISKTARFLQTYFGCERQKEGSTPEGTVADLTVLLGNDFADRYR